MDLNAALEWYVELAGKPGWKAYVWDRVQQMALEHPAEFRELPELLKAEMQRRTEKKETEE